MFHLRRIPKSVAARCRLLSSLQNKPLVGVTVDQDGIATLQMQRAPVNCLNLDLLQAIRDSVCEAEENKCKGIVLSSEFPTVFSAGMDLNEFYKPDMKRFIQMKESIIDAVVKVFGTDLITTVAINGYTAAGGCMLALTFDYRAMTTGHATIGLNDTAVGIAPAKWIIDLMSRVMGHRNAEYALTSSFMYPAEQALQVGLIDDIATDKMDAIEKCKAFIRRYDHISPVVRAATKKTLREDYLAQLEKDRKLIAKNFIALITRPAFQDKINQYLQSIKQKKTSKD